MNQPSTEPEFILQESVKTLPMEKLRDFSVLDYQELKVDLLELSQALNMLVDISERIRGLVQGLQLSLVEQQ